MLDFGLAFERFFLPDRGGALYSGECGLRNIQIIWSVPSVIVSIPLNRPR
jgi:hypothetical protein